VSTAEPVAVGLCFDDISMSSADRQLMMQEVGRSGQPLPSAVADEVVSVGNDQVSGAGCQVRELAAVGAAGDDVVLAVDDEQRLGDVGGERTHVDVAGEGDGFVAVTRAGGEDGAQDFGQVLPR
jgi:hypothetical protein